MAEFEGDGLVVAATPGCLQFHSQFIEFDGEEFDGHIPVECFGIRPALHSVTVRQLLVYTEESIKLIVVYMPVLEGAGIHILMYTVEDFVPFPLMLLHRHGLCFGKRSTRRSHRFLAVNPGGDESGQPAGNLFALPPHCPETFYRTAVRTGYFSAEVPSAKTFILLSITFPDLIYHKTIILDIVAHIPGVPPLSGIIEAKHELHFIFLCQPAEHIYQIDRRHITAFLQQIGRWIGDKLAISAADVDHRVYTDCFHISEIRIPFLLSPVLMRYIVGYLVQEGACYREAGAVRNNQDIFPGRAICDARIQQRSSRCCSNGKSRFFDKRPAILH